MIDPLAILIAVCLLGLYIVIRIACGVAPRLVQRQAMTRSVAGNHGTGTLVCGCGPVALG